MPRKILVTSALPYANGSLHLGHIIETVQTDIWVRFQRMQGHDCIYVCAEDTHGTPVMIKAQAEGITPEELITRMAAEHRADYEGFLIGHDHFHSTHSPENKAITAELYGKLKAAGHITTRSVRQAYDEKAGMFLPDRYVKGECPVCHTADQYGDSCENCGSTYTPDKLINPVSTISGTPPVLRESEHYFFKLGDFTDVLRQWLEGGGARQPEVRAKLAEWFEAGLQDWDISRDEPYFGFEIPGAPGKYFYVWFDAPIGYLGSFKALVRQARARLRRIPEGRQHHRAVSLHRQGHQLLPQPVLARGAARLGLPQADGGVRARLPHDQRREDVEVARHVHHGAPLSRTPAARAAAFLFRRQARMPASTTSTCRWKISSRA